jgi:fimbrial chaperone protein
MPPIRPLLILVTSAIVVATSVAQAASLSVLPITVTVTQPATLGTITLHNREERPLNAQIRVFHWTQSDGGDQLDETSDVIASPPIVTINPNEDYVVRLQRVGAGEIKGEEAYRTVVDELPNPNRQRNGAIAIVLRYLVPTFFLSPDASQPRLAWSIENHGGKAVLVAANSGDIRIRLADLKIKTGGRVITVGRGLAGYVLGRSTREWPIPGNAGVASVVMADTDHGPIQATPTH